MRDMLSFGRNSEGRGALGVACRSLQFGASRLASSGVAGPLGAGCRSLSFAFGVMAVARDFHSAGRVVAVVAAILLAFIHQAVARRGGAFLFLLSHDTCLLLVHGFFAGRRFVGGVILNGRSYACLRGGLNAALG